MHIETDHEADAKAMDILSRAHSAVLDDDDLTRGRRYEAARTVTRAICRVAGVHNMPCPPGLSETAGPGVQYVNAYETDRAYGGPEEGGWWFDCGTLLKSIPCTTRAQVIAALAALEAEFGPRYAGKPDIGSVCCEGVLKIYTEDTRGADYPTVRPHYE